MRMALDSWESVAEEWADEAKKLLRENIALKAHRQLLRDACFAAIEYDKAIRACANDPEKMASFCTAQGQNLDDLYLAWIGATRNAIYKTGEEEKNE
jgi:hypothetical protein